MIWISNVFYQIDYLLQPTPPPERPCWYEEALRKQKEAQDTFDLGDTIRDWNDSQSKRTRFRPIRTDHNFSLCQADRSTGQDKVQLLSVDDTLSYGSVALWGVEFGSLFYTSRSKRRNQVEEHPDQDAMDCGSVEGDQGNLRCLRDSETLSAGEPNLKAPAVWVEGELSTMQHSTGGQPVSDLFLEITPPPCFEMLKNKGNNLWIGCI